MRRPTRINVHSTARPSINSRQHEFEVGRVRAVGRGGVVYVDGYARREDGAGRRGEEGVHEFDAEGSVGAGGERALRSWGGVEGGVGDLRARGGGERYRGYAFDGCFAGRTTVNISRDYVNPRVSSKSIVRTLFRTPRQWDPGYLSSYA